MKNKREMPKVLKIVIGVVIALIAVVAGYLAYLLISY